MTWWNDFFKYKRQLNVINAGAGALTDFVATVVLSPGRYDAESIQADGDDLRMVNSAEDAVLAYDIVGDWTSTGTNIVHVLIPAVGDNTNAGTIFFYCGNADAANAEDPATVYANCQGWWGFNDASDMGADATPNANDLTITTPSQLSHTTAGKISGAVKFTSGYGTNAYCESADFSPGTSDFSVVLWYKADYTDVYGWVVNLASVTGIWSLSLNPGPDWHRMEFRASGPGGLAWQPYSEQDNIVDGEYHLLAAVWDRDGKLTRYVDAEKYGDEKDISAAASQDLGPAGATSTIHVGHRGTLDEVRVFHRVVTQDELKAWYRHESDGGFTYGGEQIVTGSELDIRAITTEGLIRTKTDKRLMLLVTRGMLGYSAVTVGLSFTEIYTGGDATGEPYWTSLNTVTYRANGKSPGLLRLKADRSGFYEACVTKPDWTPTVGVWGAGDITVAAGQTLEVYCTYYCSATGIESDPGPVKVYDTAGGPSGLRIGNFAASGQSDIDKIRVYRSIADTKGTHATWYRIDEVDHTATHTDEDTADADITAGNQMEPDGDHASATTDIDRIIAWDGRLFARFANAREQIRYSGDAAGYWPVTNCENPPTDLGDVIMFGNWQDQLIVAMERGALELTGTAGLYAQNVIDDDRGIISARTMKYIPAKGGGMVVWLATNGVCAYRGSMVVDIGEGLEEILEACEPEYMRASWAAVLPAYDLYILGIRKRDETGGYYMLALHYMISDPMQHAVWTPWDRVNAILCMDGSTEPCGDFSIFMKSDDVYFYDPKKWWEDAGTTIPFRAKLRTNDLGLPGIVKAIQYVAIRNRQPMDSEDTSDLAVRDYVDESSEITKAVNLDLRKRHTRRRLDVRGVNHQLEIANTSTERLELSHLMLDVLETKRPTDQD